MTTHTWTCAPYWNNDAQWRDWGSTIPTALAAIGLVQTSDTGQINWTTSTLPAGSDGRSGYEIWRFNDAAQSTAPLYFRLDYGVHGFTAQGAIDITLGKGSSGAGVITGVIQSQVTVGQHNANAGGNCFASSSSGGIAIYVAPASGTIGFAIERSLDATGAATGDGVALVTGDPLPSSPGMNWRVYSYPSPLVYVRGWSPITLPYSYGSNTFNSSASVSKDAAIGPVFPIPLSCTGVPPWISQQLVAIAPADAGVFTAAPYGTNRIYRGFAFLGSTCPVTAYHGQANNMVPAGIYWE